MEPFYRTDSWCWDVNRFYGVQRIYPTCGKKLLMMDFGATTVLFMVKRDKCSTEHTMRKLDWQFCPKTALPSQRTNILNLGWFTGLLCSSNDVWSSRTFFFDFLFFFVSFCLAFLIICFCCSAFPSSCFASLFFCFSASPLFCFFVSFVFRFLWFSSSSFFLAFRRVSFSASSLFCFSVVVFFYFFFSLVEINTNISIWNQPRDDRRKNKMDSDHT